MLKQINRFLNSFEEWLIATLIASATLIIFVAVVHRYLAGVPIPYLQDFLLSINMSWAQELCIYMFIWMAKFGAAYGVRTGIHIGVDALINQLNDKWRSKFIIFGLLAGALFTGIIAILGGVFVYEMSNISITTPDLEIPIWIVYLAIPLGSALMCYRFLQVCWNFIKTGSLPKHEVKVDGINETSILEAKLPEDLFPKDLKGDKK